MAKMLYALLTVFSIELALWWFGGTTTASTSLFSLLSNPSSTSTLFVVFIAAIGTLAAGTIVASAFYQINIFGVYAGVAGISIYFALSIMTFFNFIHGQLSSLGSETFAVPIAAIIVAPILLMYIVSTMEWVRSNT